MKHLFLSLALLPLAFLSAQEHASVGIRPLSSETANEMREMRSREEPEDSDSLDCKEQAGCYHDDCYPAVYYPPSCHWMVALSALGDSLEIEDGSIWKVESYGGYKILNWHSNDPLLLTQNREWFSPYEYRLINKNTGSSVAVNLFAGPVLDCDFSRSIVAIDYDHGEMVLSDNSRWAISSRDVYFMREWALNDYIIVGCNSGWDSFCDSILINVNMNSFIRAKQY